MLRFRCAELTQKLKYPPPGRPKHQAKPDGSGKPSPTVGVRQTAARTSPVWMAHAVIIGAGPNGLVAANVLADAEWDVLVLEEQPEPGGAVRSGEVTLPGYVHDRFSAFYPLAVASPPM